MYADAHLYVGVALAGLVSFLSPCVVPLVPPYLVYLSATSIEHMTAVGGRAGDAGRGIVLTSVFFVLGFATVFVALGAGASPLGQYLGRTRGELSTVAGLVIILFGLHFLGILPTPILHKGARYHQLRQTASFTGAYVIGLAFAFIWTPCVGPILAAVLAVAAHENSQATGIKLLLAYALGLGIPFILAAVAVGPFLGVMERIRRHLGTVEKGMGLLLVLAGVLFVSGSTTALGDWLLESFPGVSTIEEAVTPATLRGEIIKRASGP